MLKRTLGVTLVLSLFSGFPLHVHAALPVPLVHEKARAEKAGAVLAEPVFEKTPEDVTASADRAIAEAEKALQRIEQQPQAEATFVTTAAALDLVVGDFASVQGRLGLIQNTHPSEPVRNAARAARAKLDAWLIGVEYRQDLYRIIKHVADQKPTLDAQEEKLLREQLRDFRRAGLELPAAERAQVQALRQELTQLQTQFSSNITQATAPLEFTAEELAGVPDSFLGSPGVKQPDGRYRVMANVTWHAAAIADNATQEATRRTVHLARNRLARETNETVLKKMVTLRADIARRLGYATWADFQLETRMAKNAATAIGFEEELVRGLQSKFEGELEELRKMKVAATGAPDARVEPWDVPYFVNQLKKERYTVDTEALRAYFPYDYTLAGMLKTYERIFGLRFIEIEPEYRWNGDVQLFVAIDAAKDVPLGLFYLDMFPREGKYNHFACFPIQLGRKLGDGRYELPVVSLVCNFPPPTTERPSLLLHSDVETLFHEFGHVMHAILGRSRFFGQASFLVPRDFVEAPSQTLERWVWDKKVLDTFAADYRTPMKKFPAETLEAMKQAQKATAGIFYRRQLALGLLDLELHTLGADQKDPDIIKLSNDVLARVSVKPADDTAFATYFGHLASYDAGYYGYMWSLAIGIDMASQFESAPGGFLDRQLGRRLRDEIYTVGNTRDVNESVERFLGRPRSVEPFLRFLGVDQKTPAPAAKATPPAGTN